MQSSFKMRLFRTYAPVSIAIIFLVIAVLFVITFNKNREVEFYKASEELHAGVFKLTNTFDQMRNLSQQILANRNFLEHFRKASLSEDEGNYFAQNPDAETEVQQFLQSINSVDNSAMRISAYNDRGDYIGDDAPVAQFDIEISELFNPEFAQTHFDIIRNNGGEFVISGPHPDYITGDSNLELISYMCYIKPWKGSENYGILDIQYLKSDLEKISFFEEKADSCFALVDNYGRAGLSRNITIERAIEIYDDLLEVEAKTGRKQTIFRADGVRYLATGEIERRSNWMLIHIQKLAPLDREYMVVYVYILFSGILLILASILLFYKVSERVSRPLQMLTASISRVNLHDMHVSPLLERYQIQELNQLNCSFNEMIQRLETAIDSEMTAYSYALQSQTNPHFLYNCLSLIAEKADEDGSTSSVLLCQKLSAMLRYLADQTTDLVPLHAEVQHLRNYLDMMCARYEEYFSYEIRECDEIMNVTVPRVLLQPLVENCFQHGFQTVNPPWHICVEMERSGDEWRLSIIDNGSGIPKDVLQTLFAQIEEYKRNMSDNFQGLRMGGMGLVNVFMRLKLLERDGLIFDISSPPEGGTIIRIGGRMEV